MIQEMQLGQAQAKPMDIVGFLAWEERQELRHEFDGVHATAMAGGTIAHGAIQFGIAGALRAHLRGKPCRPYGSEVKIQTGNGIRYPDAFVVCTPLVPRATVVGDPVVIFEILSEGTEKEDLVVKAAEYQSMASVQRYIVLQQTHRVAMVYSRRGDGWDFGFVSGEGAMLDMPEIGIRVPLAEIYEDITLESDIPAQ